MLTKGDLLAIEREYCKRSLANFARRAWPILEPGTDLKWGWALDAICEHLEAVTNGHITRLLMNVPPGSMKSLLTGVLWPAWEWGPCGMPEKRFIGTAHQQNLAIRDAMKCRRLIQSEWYQSLWPIALTSDQNAKTKFENEYTGFREAMAFTSMTGSRGDRIILDDPLSADAANSPAELESTRITFTETLPTRVNNDRSAIVVIMQRLSEGDTSGVILDMGLPYTHLVIPMRYELGESKTTSLGWTDPRTREGELMFPERFSEEQVLDLERTLGPYGVAGQLQQRPAPRGGGGYFESDWFRSYEAAPPRDTMRVYGASDYAVTSNGGDYTVHVVVGVDPDNRLWLLDMWRGQSSSDVWVDAFCDLVAKWRPIGWAEETGQIKSGVGPFLTRRMIERQTYVHRESFPTRGDKAVRAQSIRGRMAMMGLHIPKNAAWRPAFEAEFLMFPVGVHDDQVDAMGLVGQLLDKMRAGVARTEAKKPAPVGGVLLEGVPKARSAKRITV